MAGMLTRIGPGATIALLVLAGASAAAAQAGYQPPRTAWGHPLIQGVYTNNTDVALERPRELGSKEFFTEAEYQAWRASRPAVMDTEPGTVADVHYPDDDYAATPELNEMVKSLRTSLITRPADGRLPRLTESAQQRSDAARAAARATTYDSAQDRPLGERCIIWPHVGPPARPVAYNSHVQIMQSPQHVVLVTEMIHDARVIVLAGSRPDFGGVRRWQGNSWGRWEGDTLVVETTGFLPRYLPRGSNVPWGPDAKVIEKLTRVDEKTVRYEFDVSDPSLWVSDWGGEYPMQLIEGPMFEYACHEGNYGIANTLSGAREDERRAAGER